MSLAITLTIADGCPAQQRYVFTKAARCQVGRAEDCDIRFPTDLWHSTISRHHCLFKIEPPRISVRDLGSLTGTYVNGQLIGQRRVDQPREEVDLRAFAPHPLEEGDEVRIGPVTLQVGRTTSVPAVDRPLPFPAVPMLP
jgi:eukaryotic-like serine/threonine-protein kinase